MYTHIPAVFCLYCFVSKFLSHCSKYCYFNYFWRVWSPPAAGSELLVLTWMSWGVRRVVRYSLVPSQILTITFPSHPCLPGVVGNICGFRGFSLEVQKEISFSNLRKGGLTSDQIPDVGAEGERRERWQEPQSPKNGPELTEELLTLARPTSWLRPLWAHALPVA